MVENFSDRYGYRGTDAEITIRDGAPNGLRFALLKWIGPPTAARRPSGALQGDRQDGLGKFAQCDPLEAHTDGRGCWHFAVESGVCRAQAASDQAV